MFDKTTIITTFSLIGVAVLVIIGYRYNQLRLAHESFEGYYKYAGCVQLYAQTDTSGACQSEQGQIIGISQASDGKWYSDIDKPVDITQ